MQRNVGCALTLFINGDIWIVTCKHVFILFIKSMLYKLMIKLNFQKSDSSFFTQLLKFLHKYAKFQRVSLF